MLGSRSKYFFQDKTVLDKGRDTLEVFLLVVLRFSDEKSNLYLKVYDYFCENPSGYDGATIVKDLYCIPGLDINAMLHDYHYIRYNCAASIRMKWLADWIYAKEMERTGKGQLAWVNWFLLKLSGTLFLLYTVFKRGCPTMCQKVRFEKEYKLLIE